MPPCSTACRVRGRWLDVIFAEPDTINPNDDAILADSLRRNGRAVLPVVLDRLDHPGSMSLPIRRWPRPRRAGLHQRAHRRRRRGARKLRVHYDGDWWRHLALTLLRIGGESDVAGRLLKRAQPDGGILIPYSGPPAHTRTVSYLSVLRGDLPANATRQYVLVGAWATGLSDTYPTPVSHDTSGMSGVEIVANVLQAARDDIAYRRRRRLNALFSALPALLACRPCGGFRPSAPCWCASRCWPPCWRHRCCCCRRPICGSPQRGAAGRRAQLSDVELAQPEAALRYMDYELRRLQREYPPVLNEARAQSFGHSASLEHRVGELSRALARVRNLRRFGGRLDGMPDATLVFDEQGRMQFRNRPR